MDRDTGDIDDLGDTLLKEGKLLAIWTDPSLWKYETNLAFLRELEHLEYKFDVKQP